MVKERSIGDDKNENLVSISVDGCVLQWSIRKGFESSQLMKLKRMNTPKPVDKKAKTKHGSRVNPAAVLQRGGGEAYISQHSPGMGFDFSPRDSNMYGTYYSDVSMMIIFITNMQLLGMHRGGIYPQVFLFIQRTSTRNILWTYCT